MPSNAITLDANGNGTFRFVGQISQLSVINQSGGSISIQINEIGESLTLNANTALEFEEDEAREVNTIHFSNGVANSRSVIIYWTASTLIQRYLPH